MGAETPSQFQFQLPDEVVISVSDGDDFESDSVELCEEPGAVLLLAIGAVEIFH